MVLLKYKKTYLFPINLIMTNIICEKTTMRSIAISIYLGVNNRHNYIVSINNANNIYSLYHTIVDIIFESVFFL